MKSRHSTLVLCVFAAASLARAQFSGVWTGDAVTAGFQDADNWQGQVQPSLNNGTENISFGDIGNTPPTQTSPVLPVGGYWLNNISFGTNRPAYTFSGPATLTLSGGITAASSANAVNLAANLGVSLTAGYHTVDLAGAGTSLVVAGGITGTGGITKTGLGLLTLTGANTNTGGTNIRAGILHLDGGSLAQGSGDMTVGDLNGDSGTLTITNGGDLTNDTGYIGLDAGSTGTVSVSGSGSSWTNTTTINVGYEGTGVLAVSGGADVSGGATFIGTITGGTGTVTVDGAGSTFTATSLDVGSEGSGTLTITNGGVATSTSLSYIGEDTGTTGTVLVDGAGSALSYSNLILARWGTGNLLLSNGGAVSVNSGAGTITLAQSTGAAGTLYIGGITPGTAGVVNAATITTGLGTGIVKFNTTATAGSAYYLTKDGTSGGTPVAISGPTQLQQLAGYNVILGGSNYTGGTTITGGTLQAAHSNALGTGSVTVSGSGTLLVNEYFVNSSVQVNSGGRLAGIYGGYTEAIINAGGKLAPGIAATGSGAFASLDFEDLTLGQNGIFEINLSFNGETFEHDKAYVQNSSTLTINATPANPFSLKVISLDSNYQLGALEGLVPGQSYSWLIFDTNGIYDITTQSAAITAASFAFDDSEFSTVLGEGVFSVSQSGNDIYLNFTPVPEPSTYALMLAGLGLAGFRAWRKRRA